MKVDWKSCVRIGISVFLLYLCITYWPAFADLFHSLLPAAALYRLVKEDVNHSQTKECIKV